MNSGSDNASSMLGFAFVGPFVSQKLFIAAIAWIMAANLSRFAASFWCSGVHGQVTLQLIPLRLKELNSTETTSQKVRYSLDMMILCSG